MGILQHYGMKCTHPSINWARWPYVLRPDSQNLPDQTYNGTVAMAVGRKPGLLSYSLMRF